MLFLQVCDIICYTFLYSLFRLLERERDRCFFLSASRKTREGSICEGMAVTQHWSCPDALREGRAGRKPGSHPCQPARGRGQGRRFSVLSRDEHKRLYQSSAVA